MKKQFYTLCLATVAASAVQAQRVDLTPIAAWDFESTQSQTYASLTQEEAIARGIVVSNALQKQLIAKEGEQSGNSWTDYTEASLDLSALIYPGDSVDISGTSVVAGSYNLNEVVFPASGGSTLNASYNANWGIENEAENNNGALVLRGGIGDQNITISASTKGFYGVEFAFDAKSLTSEFESTPSVNVMVDGTAYPVTVTQTVSPNYSQFVFELPYQADDKSSVEVTINLNSTYTPASATSSLAGTGVMLDNIQLRGYKIGYTSGDAEIQHINLFTGTQGLNEGFVMVEDATFYASSYPYLYHPELGYVYVPNGVAIQGAATSDTNNGWLYSYAQIDGSAIGWVFVDFDYFPWIYAPVADSGNGSWVYVFTDETNAGSLYVDTTQSMVTYTK
ncbi:MAG: hypothetical protein E1N59_2601 [Puniceicoccaceae bacterium 5H]|nr:MAG: hypothetical protein E1N59_2601 [Puniceicoccaceae bacterium 5H]